VNENEKLLNLLRISDTFFPMGSFAMSQGMEQIVNDELVPQEKIGKIVKMYLEKIWKSFELGIFYMALDAVKKNNLDELMKIDEICYCSKITEENRESIIKMGNNMLNIIDFDENSLEATYKSLVKDEKAYGSYPVVLALSSHQLELNELGAISLVYVNLMEITASLVRMGMIDYVDAQKILKDEMKSISIEQPKFCDLYQSLPLADIASMRHERSQSRMFMS